MGKKVLISGAGIAGPALAYWLGRRDFEVTVVEVTPSPRMGGQAVDFRGDTHLTVLERMGVLDDLRRVQTGGGSLRFLDESGRTRLSLPAEFTGGDVEVLRGDLSRVLYEHSITYADYRFGESIADLSQDADGVHVQFHSGQVGTFDFVVGADGLHSNVRCLAFGPEEQYVTHLGYYAASWILPNHLGIGLEGGSVGVNVPGRFASVSTSKQNPESARAFFVFAADRLTYNRHDQEQQKAIIAKAFAGIRWEVPQLLETLKTTDDLYFDSISRADVPRWSAGRVVLIGDAACGATIGGMGTGTAVVAAYTLGGELTAANGDHNAAFPRYEALLRDYAQRCQKGGDRTGKFLAPGGLGLRMRDWMLNRPRILEWMLKEGKKAAGVELPDYRQSAGKAD